MVSAQYLPGHAPGPGIRGRKDLLNPPIRSAGHMKLAQSVIRHNRTSPH